MTEAKQNSEIFRNDNGCVVLLCPIYCCTYYKEVLFEKDE